MTDRIDKAEAFFGPLVAKLRQAKIEDKSTTEIVRDLCEALDFAADVKDLEGKELVEEFLDHLLAQLESNYIFMVPRLDGYWAIKPGYFFLDHEGKTRTAERVAVGRNDYSIQDISGKWHYFEHDEMIESELGCRGKRGFFLTTKFFSQYSTLPPVVTKEDWINGDNQKAANDFINKIIELETNQEKKEEFLGRYDHVELSLVKKVGENEEVLAGPFIVRK